MVKSWVKHYDCLLINLCFVGGVFTQVERISLRPVFNPGLSSFLYFFYSQVYKQAFVLINGVGGGFLHFFHRPYYKNNYLLN